HPNGLRLQRSFTTSGCHPWATRIFGISVKASSMKPILQKLCASSNNMKIGRIKSEKTPNACHEAASETIPRHDSCNYMKFAKQIGLFLGSALLMLQLVGCCTKPVKSPAWDYRVITRSGVSTDYTSE